MKKEFMKGDEVYLNDLGLEGLGLRKEQVKKTLIISNNVTFREFDYQVEVFFTEGGSSPFLVKKTEIGVLNPFKKIKMCLR